MKTFLFSPVPEGEVGAKHDHEREEESKKGLWGRLPRMALRQEEQPRADFLAAVPTNPICE